MDNEQYKFVEFEKYCDSCKYKNTKADDDPCDECLSISARLYSHKPEKYEKS